MATLARAERPTLDRRVPWALAAVLALAVWAPVLGRGYVLVYDMVFTPHPPVGSASLGVDGGVPRAVPADFLVALAAHVVPAWVLQEAILVAVVVLACIGAWRVSPARTLTGAGLSALLYSWNAYVAERLLMGHWSLLVGYAVLPWLLRASGRVRTAGPWPVVLWCAVGAAAAPTSGVLTLVVAWAAAVLVAQPRWSRVVCLVGPLVVNLPWLLAGLASSGLLNTSRIGTDVFAARADTPLGGPVSLLTFGGSWNSDVWPAARASAFSGAAILVLVLVGMLGLVVAVRRRSPAATVAVTVGALGLLLSVPTLYPAGRDVFAALTAHVPAAGILRDSQKWLAWWALAVAYGVGPGIERLTERLAGWNRVWVASAAGIVVLAAMPGLAWGVGGSLTAVRWPADYEAAAQAVDRVPGDAPVLVLPFHQFRAWSWNDRHTSLDPWARLVGRPVVVNDTLETTGGTVPGEDPLAERVRRLPVEGGRYSADALRRAGIRLVVVDRDTAQAPGDATGVTGTATVVYDGPHVLVLDLGPPVAVATDHRWWLVGADLAVVVVVGITAGLAVLRRRRS